MPVRVDRTDGEHLSRPRTVDLALKAGGARRGDRAKLVLLRTRKELPPLDRRRAVPARERGHRRRAGQLHGELWTGLGVAPPAIAEGAVAAVVLGQAPVVQQPSAR